MQSFFLKILGYAEVLFDEDSLGEDGYFRNRSWLRLRVILPNMAQFSRFWRKLSPHTGSTKPCSGIENEPSQFEHLPAINHVRVFEEKNRTSCKVNNFETFHSHRRCVHWDC